MDMLVRGKYTRRFFDVHEYGSPEAVAIDERVRVCKERREAAKKKKKQEDAAEVTAAAVAADAATTAASSGDKAHGASASASSSATAASSPKIPSPTGGSGEPDAARAETKETTDKMEREQREKERKESVGWFEDDLLSGTHRMPIVLRGPDSMFVLKTLREFTESSKTDLIKPKRYFKVTLPLHAHAHTNAHTRGHARTRSRHALTVLPGQDPPRPDPLVPVQERLVRRRQGK